MEPKARKEIIQVNGLSILIAMMLIGNLLTVGIIARYHKWQLVEQEKRDNRSFTKVLKEEHDLKLEIQRLEGAKNWVSTMYARAHNERTPDDPKEMERLRDLLSPYATPQ